MSTATVDEVVTELGGKVVKIVTPDLTVEGGWYASGWHCSRNDSGVEIAHYHETPEFGAREALKRCRQQRIEAARQKATE